MPTETDRASIASQIEGIERGLMPGYRQEMVANIATMMLGFPVYGGDEESVGATLDAYADNVADMPGWAVATACERLAKGQGPGKPGNRPSHAELRIMVERELLPHRAMIAKLGRVLAAEPMRRVIRSPEDRERMAKKAGDFLANFDGKVRDEKSRSAQYHDETKRAKA